MSNEQNQQEQPKVTNSDIIYKGKVVTLKVDSIEEADGTKYKREIVAHPGAVVMIPVADDGKLLLVKQWRQPTGKTLVELPAGTLEAGEPPDACAERELQEEIGYKPAKLTSLGGFFSAPGFCTEYLHLFLAEGLTPDRKQGDEDEHIEVLPTTLEEALQLIENGTICDAKSVAGILRYALTKQKS